jgi:hypothetical protein
MSNYKYIYSILVPSRERLFEARRLVQSIKDTTYNPATIEVLFALDNDHQPTINNVIQLQTEYPELNIKYFLRDRSEFINGDYYDWLAGKAEGRFLWISADDLIFLVKDWDIIIKNKLEEYLKDKPDKLLCASILDNTPAPGEPPGDKREFPCFPLFTREVLDVLGFILPPQLPTWGADRYIYSLFTKIDRLCWIHDQCYLNHASYHTLAGPADSISERVGELCAKWATIPLHMPHKQEETILRQANNLKVFIQNKKV